ncbi:MAG: hypothetical protein EXR59_01975 [Dehalococcoidia bacterium]|nr:hypothetical protein [Dehalococcoidia bacterium]
MIYWAPLLHMYQPPTQIHMILDKVCRESYRPLIEVFKSHPQAKATVNISGCLTEMLQEHGFQDVIDGLRDLSERGQLEFVGSAKYHAILPLIPQEEAARQIARNKVTNSKFFGSSYNPKGFFPPEMAYSSKVAQPIIDSRHKWILISGVACPTHWPVDRVDYIKRGDDELGVFFRDDLLSNNISFDRISATEFIDKLKRVQSYSGKKDVYVITAMDAETFGHHILDWEKLFLADVYNRIDGALAKTSDPLASRTKEIIEFGEKLTEPELRVVNISELLTLFPKGYQIEPKPSSWSTSAADIEFENPFPLWNDPGNPLHKLLWQHLNLTIEMVNESQLATKPKSKTSAEVGRVMLDPALHSCQFWWASQRPMWDVNMVYRGLLEQREAMMNAYKAIVTDDFDERTKHEYQLKFLASQKIQDMIVDLLVNDNRA